MCWRSLILLIVSFLPSFHAYHYDPQYIAYNLNTNRTAATVLDYWGSRDSDHKYTASPENWRFPFYTLFLDRFVNGDPFNDNINGTRFETDFASNQMRHGGDLQGLLDSLDYIHGMGIKGIYIAGSPFINMPWGYDGYSPLDLSILDPHFGPLRLWQSAVDEIHARGMYVILDNTFATLGDLLGFQGFLNSTAPFSTTEHRVEYKSDRQYYDFHPSNNYNATCNYPRFWNETGQRVDQSVYDSLHGCYDSDFDQYGDTEAFGVYPDWRRELTKFASVQDRLREWHEPVRLKIQNFYCMMIAQLDIDGYRYDKALQSTPDALGAMNGAMRACARRYGKENFFLPGEITGGNNLASVWTGRGRQPDMLPENVTVAVTAGQSTQKYSIRDADQAALDGGAFHYTVYRTLTRFLGMDGNLEAGYDAPLNFVDMWNTFMLTNDFTNANNGKFDPRHMYGVTNQDVFRWPAIKDGVQRQLLGHFVTNLLMPGLPLILWGEEQSFYVLDSTASNYIFGRQPISASSAWQTHGCYSLGSTQYYQYPVDAARHGCTDDTVSYDHRDPSAPVRNILKHMFNLRETYPVLKDGAWLQQLSNATQDIFYPGSSGKATETGLWSVVRSSIPNLQTTNSTRSNVPVWLVYTNRNTTTNNTFDCSDSTTGLKSRALLSPFSESTQVKNILYPYDVLTIGTSSVTQGLAGSSDKPGCVSSMQMDAYGFKAYVPLSSWVEPQAMLTKFIVNDDDSLGHDGRIVSKTPADAADQVKIEFQFSSSLDCANVTKSLQLQARTLSGRTASLDTSTVACGNAASTTDPKLQAVFKSAWRWTGTLVNVEDGVHQVSLSGVLGNYTDNFLFRIGQSDNPVIFPRSANYSSSLVQQDNSGNLYLVHKADGADLWRYTTDWGSTFSAWMSYTGGNTTIDLMRQEGPDGKAWQDTHVRVEYFVRRAGTNAVVQEGDLKHHTQRRFPQLFWNGPYNEYGYDSGLENAMKQDKQGQWKFDFMTEWPAIAQVSVWGLNNDGTPNQDYVMGDVDGDSVLDRMPPSALGAVVVNITSPPANPFLSWTIKIDDATRHFTVLAAGSVPKQIILYMLLWIIPVVSALASVYVFKRGFYQVKFNQIGFKKDPTMTFVAIKESVIGFFKRRQKVKANTGGKSAMDLVRSASARKIFNKTFGPTKPRRTVLIATMEYNIDDWQIKVKIGGLGVMSQLMSNVLRHQDLIWVIPCVGGITYPMDTPAEPMTVNVLGIQYSVAVQYHKLENITYVLLDAPVFRQQTKEEPYPARMDDMTSAIYYSAWNQCIAQTIRRFPIDLYHINDYHGAIAPLYLLPNSIPVCLSLHNAEFQGLWPMRSPAECNEVSEVFNLTPEVVQSFAQFGEVFNLLHAGASYLRVYQQGFGAVGVSQKYGRRAHLRYPIFWGLKKIGQLPNPDPTDTAEWDGKITRDEQVTIDQEFEAKRPGLRVEAQRWAGLDEDPTAELFVFVGRWSHQKGVDLIADVFPSILKKHPKSQLICVGPIIDLYGKFAALKLDKLMEQYPTRVCSKPVFTALPPCVFSGAEFALIPSRDEPFGLVAVEFGRKGALGIGARVGGLVDKIGWYYTVEAVTTQHLLDQFRQAIASAIASGPEMRATMRARAQKQRFPVAQWLDKLDVLQATAIEVHNKQSAKTGRSNRTTMNSTMSLTNTKFRVPMGPTGSEEDISIVVDDTSRNSSDPYVLPSGYQTPNTLVGGGSPGPVSRISSFGNIAGMLQEGGRSSTHLPFFASEASPLATNAVVGEKKDYFLQRVDPSFTDSKGVYYTEFSKRLDKSGAMLESDVCIEEYLVKSEKEWFQSYLNARLAKDVNKGEASTTPRKSMIRSSVFKAPSVSWTANSKTPAASTKDDSEGSLEKGYDDTFEGFLHESSHGKTSRVEKWMQYRYRDWPVYSFLLALGQILAANSYQITLLTGQIGEAADKVYAICGIYFAASICFWMLFRKVPSVIVLSLPFAIYGLAFIILGFSRFGSTYTARTWVQNVGTGLYAIASASGSLYFALNFGDEGGSTVRSWIFRACTIQGTQQIYIAALWFWGSSLNKQRAAGLMAGAAYQPWIQSWKSTAICLPIGIALFAVAAIVYYGLPTYYRNAPGHIPSFYSSVLRRKVIAWFFITVIIQNFFLSAQYGRSWSFLWSSQHAKQWQIALLVIVFFVIVWAIMLWIMSIFSHQHSWLLPILAIGLGAPRWAQMWWGTSGMGLWLPWTNGYIASALVSRSLWLWLGVLDTVQSVGVGMILLSTMTRNHVAFTLIASQMIGSTVTAIARACAPNNVGPGSVFPNLLTNAAGLANGWFWAGLLLNVGICIGFFLFFRKEQLSKP